MPSGESPNSKKNLTNRWAKGQQPWNHGKKLFHIPTALRGKLAEVDPADKQGRTHGEVMIDKAIWMCNYGPNGQGSIKAISEVFDRLLGRPAQAVVTVDATQLSATEKVENVLQILERLEGRRRCRIWR